MKHLGVTAPMISLVAQFLNDLFENRRLDIRGEHDIDARWLLGVGQLPLQSLSCLMNEQPFAFSEFFKPTKDGNGFTFKDQSISLATRKIGIQRFPQRIHAVSNGCFRQSEESRNIVQCGHGRSIQESCGHFV